MVEIPMFAAGVWLYWRASRGRDRIGRYAFAAYLGLLLVLYFGGRFSPPPSSIADVAWTGIAAAVILIPWAGWFDRHRVQY